MAVWNVPQDRRRGPRREPRALRELAVRLESDPVRAWEWIERLQSTEPDDDPTNRARGAVATPHAIAARMAGALVRGAPRGGVWRILDAGCGRGRLLTAAARAASERGCSVDCEGVEVDAIAARWAQALEPLVRAGTNGRLRSWRVRRADFLLSPSPSADCDAVIANPPYVPVRALDAVVRERLRGREPAGAAGDLAAYFLARLLGRLRPGGRLVAIVPNKLLAARYAARLRHRLLTEMCIEELWDFSGTRVFRGWQSYPVVIVARRAPTPDTHRVRIRDARGRVRAEWPRIALDKLPDSILPLGMDPALLALAGAWFEGSCFGDHVTLRCGIATSGFGRAIGSGAERILCAGDVRAYRTAPARPFSPQRAALAAGALERFRGRKILVPGMFRRLCAAADESGAALGRVYFIPLDGVTERDRAVVLALLNSRLYGVLYASLFAGVAQSGGYLRLNAPYLAALPWPRLSPPGDLVALVTALERGEAGGAQSRLDRAIETAFGLSAAERRRLDRLARNLPVAAPFPHEPRSRRPHSTPSSTRAARPTRGRETSSEIDAGPFQIGMDVA